MANATPPDEKKYLIISPQAGFGNRIRAVCSAILVARRTSRAIFHCWTGTDPTPCHPTTENVRIMKGVPWGHYFREHPGFPDITQAALRPGVVLTEWQPGDFWYPYQSWIQSRFPEARKAKVAADLSSLLTEHRDARCVLLETSLTVNLGTPFTDQEMMEVYSEYFRPSDKFARLLDATPDIDLGMSVRRINFINYFPAANQSMEDILDWLCVVISRHQIRTALLLSDDDPFIREMSKAVAAKTSVEIVRPDYSALVGHEIPYFQFLLLARKCRKIYGTPHSSFAEEAGLFGGKNHYRRILHTLE